MQQQSLHLSWYWYRQQSEETWLRSWEATQEGGERLYPRKPKVYRSNSKFLMHVHPKTYHPLIRSFALLYFLWVIVTAVELTLWERTCYQSLLLGWKLQELLQSASRKTSEDSWQATYIRNKGSHRSCNVIPNMHGYDLNDESAQYITKIYHVLHTMTLICFVYFRACNPRFSVIFERLTERYNSYCC